MDIRPIYDSLLTYENSPDGNSIYDLRPKTVLEFFAYQEIRRIPEYQRPYSWTRDNLVDLLNDIENVSSGKFSSWFLGPIFTTKEHRHSKYSDLLDGQQRVTTLQILIQECMIFVKRHSDWSVDSLEKELKKSLNNLYSECDRCLTITGHDSIRSIKKVKFYTEDSIKSLFENYILMFSDVEDEDDYRKARATFESNADLESKNGSKTAANIKNIRFYIQDYLDENFSVLDLPYGLTMFVNFTNTLLYKFWLLEVPLQKDDDSVQIFESLNNRGKDLTLTDKLRYKCLINCSNSDVVDELRIKWKEIYVELEACLDSKYIKSDEDFFRVFFNAKLGKSITSEKSFLIEFEKLYILNGTDIETQMLLFVTECLNVLKFYTVVLSKNLDDTNLFVDKFQGSERNRVKSLLQLVKATNFADNSRFLLFSILLRRFSFSESYTHYILVQELWTFVRITYVLECVESRKSNVLREDFLGIVKEYMNSKTLDEYFERNKNVFSVKKSKLNDSLMTNDNKQAKFVLYLYTYLSEYDLLSLWAPELYKQEHVEHLFPTQWKHWSDKCYTHEDVVDFIWTITGDFNGLKRNAEGKLSVLIEIEQKESLELLTDPSAQQKQKDTLLQFIGNKWLLHYASNIKVSNKSFSSKKVELIKSSYLRFPSDNNECGLLSYEDFDFKDIIKRSLLILDMIGSKFYRSWDDV